MSNPNRLISVLELFDSGNSVLTVDAIAQSLNTSTSTAYRTVRSLVQVGFLDPVTGAGYALGPAFIRYDRVLRQHDSLIKTASPIMVELLRKTDQSATVILCRRFRGCVMCVHEVHGSKPHAPTSYERGVAMPMFIGATSKILLAQLPDRALKTVYLQNEQAIRRATNVETWADFRRQLKAIRQYGYAITDSEIAKSRSAVAAPILRDGQVVASISLVIANKALGRRSIEDLAPAVLKAADKISNRVSNHEPLLTRS